jgi:peptidase inhibitor family I36
MNRFVVKRCALGTSLVSSLVLAFATACGGGSSGAPASAPATAAAPTVCATFYADGQLKGATLVAKAPVDNSPAVPADFNDVMSSVAVTAGCTVMAYADGNYGGQEVTFTQTTESVPASINDQMSSYKCSCGSAGGGGK